MSFWDDIVSPFVQGYEAVAGAASDGFQGALSEAEKLGSAVVDVGGDVISSVEDVGVVIGDGVVAAAGTVGEGVVSFGQGVERFSVSQGGAIVDWSKTSASEVKSWTESAAGTVASFSVDAYSVAKEGVVAAWNELARLVSSELPVLGPYNRTARDIIDVVLAGLAGEIERGTRRDGTTIGFGITLTVAAASLEVGIYCDSTGEWGFFDGNIPGAGQFSFQPSLDISGDVEVTTVFGDKAAFSGRKVLSFGGRVRIKGPLRVGGWALTTPGLSFLGFRISLGLSMKTSQQESRFKLSVPQPNGEALQLGKEVFSTLSDEAPSWDAALRAKQDPSSEDRIVATALAATVSPFAPRFYGLMRPANTTAPSLSVYEYQGQPLSELGWTGYSVGPLRIFGTTLATITGAQEATLRLITGLGDPSGVSVEAQAGGRTLVLCETAPNDLSLVPYSHPAVRSGTAATFKLVRGLSGSSGISLTRFSDPTSYIVSSPLSIYLQAAANTDSFKVAATFLLDRPLPLPAAQTAYLRAGEILRQGESRRSGSGSHCVTLLSGGVLDVWRGSGPGDLATYCWGSPLGGAGPFHAVMQADGRLAVYRGADAESRQDLVWATTVNGAPGECFAAITAAGQLAVFRGTPEDAGDLVWSSSAGAQHWATARRSRIALRTFNGQYLSCFGGSGNELTATASGVGASEVFELLTLWNGKVVLCSADGKYVCAENGGDSIGTVHVDRDRIDIWESFDLTSRSDGTINLRSMKGKYLCAEGGGGGAVHANRDAAAEWERFKIVEVPREHGWKQVRPQDKLVLTSAPSAAATQNGRMWVTYRDTDNQQRVLLTYSSEFGATRALAGTVLVGGPCAVGRQGTNQVVTCHRGQNGALWVASNDGTNESWSGFESIEDAVSSSPSASTMSTGTLDLFALNSSGEVVQTYRWEGDWEDWKNLGHPSSTKLDSPPAALSDATGHHVFARGADKRLWYRHWNGQGWSAWQDLGGTLKSGPAVTSPSAGRLDVFARAEDDSLLHRTFSGGQWGAWERLGGRISSAPAAVSRWEGGIDVFARGMDNGLLQTWYASGSWKHKL